MTTDSEHPNVVEEGISVERFQVKCYICFTVKKHLDKLTKW